ncbi:acyltransferase [Fimbriiglobus ruber]|uniref:Putative acetyltransferase n=1 Tax=Fimbriiglobus ruber TaxID=1908690 RepID=A0A225DTM1_9BACT|nr:acyltransferase [Fimbriiglobus ruber]OWK42954.1 putative acetyltransferase [Fimbriiglobus ruber]
MQDVDTPPPASLAPSAAPPARVHPTALIEPRVVLGRGTSVWDNVHIRHDTTVGDECIIGEKTYIAYGVKIGHRCKINSMVYVCTSVTIEDGVMISAGTIFTNDKFPRAATPDLRHLKPSEPDDQTQETLVREGATIGAGCTIGSGLTIGRWAMVGMGALVTKSVPDYTLAIGHPAVPVGVVCRCGQLLLRYAPGESPAFEQLSCEACERLYEFEAGVVTELDLPDVPAVPPLGVPKRKSAGT